MHVVEYTKGSELENLLVTWLDSTGAIRDFSSGWTLSVKIGTTPVTTKTVGITGLAAAPNVTIAWAVDELNIAAGAYRCEVRARRISDNKDLDPVRFMLDILAAVE